MKLHLDTDLGGDIDDLCALAMLLRWPGEVEITGITTVAEHGGKRAGYVRYALDLEGGEGIPVAAGTDVSEIPYRYPMLLPPEDRYWPEPIAAAPGPVSGALELLKSSIEQGAVIVGIGPYTNLALLERAHVGILAQAKVVLMGGFLHSPPPGYPAWTREHDFNVQSDVASARFVFESCSPTLVTLAATAQTALRETHVPRLESAGALGKLIARQAVAQAEDEQIQTLHAGDEKVPPDMLNFQHDPLACAIALGWKDGATIEDVAILSEEKEGWLIQRVDPSGRPMQVVTKVDGAGFSEFWIETVLAMESEPVDPRL
ncbi:MAG: hypothetical protein QOJ65_1753 [Fimbriimonadaceae bacterium]|jgi:inosine-uridine nucleoside N-ribohydrolase|nr:hypothetical protein [Fimbriimonadaceae bacterium]